MRKAPLFAIFIFAALISISTSATAGDPEPITCAAEKTLGRPVPINLFVNEPWLTNIRDGKKKVEGRAGTRENVSCWIGRQATFYNSRQKVTVEILDVHHYGTLKEFLGAEGWANVAPHLRNIDEAVAAYLQFYPGNYIDKAGGMNGIVISVVQVLPPR